MNLRVALCGRCRLSLFSLSAAELCEDALSPTSGKGSDRQADKVLKHQEQCSEDGEMLQADFLAASDTIMVATILPEMGPAEVRAIPRPRMGPQ